MLAVLKGFGWFFLVFILSLVVTTVAFHFFMSKWAYRWSIRSVINYLAKHGRGNFIDENTYIIGVDVLTRLIWVGVFGLIMIIIGCLILPTRLMMAALICGVFVFMLVMWKFQRQFCIKIGRLTKVDYEKQIAFFVNLKNEEFTYEYIDAESATAALTVGKKYLVADYGIFGMFGPVDEYEWWG